jgi:tight adherence protein B
MVLEWKSLRSRFGEVGAMKNYQATGSTSDAPNSQQKSLIQALLVLGTGVLALLTSGSIYIAGAFSAFILIFITLARKRSESKESRAIADACPEMIDHIISGIQSGLSLNDCLIGLASRGPEVMRVYFQRFQVEMAATGNFEKSLQQVKEELGHASTDVVVESLLIAKSLGGSELLKILRLLGNFIREDLTLRREIAVKQGWIKNSAHLSAGAPWILLLLLSSQPATAQAFSTSTGIGILITGLFMTAIAYIWMNHLSKLPEPSRIFGGQ